MTTQAAPAQAPDPVAVLDAMMAQSTPSELGPAAADVDAGVLPDIISGVIVQAPPEHKQPPTAEEYSWAWNGTLPTKADGPIGLIPPMISIHFGLNPTIVVGKPSDFGPPAHILWRRSGRDVEIVVPKSENWSPDAGASPEHTISGTGPQTSSPLAVKWTLTGKLSEDGRSMSVVMDCGSCSLDIKMKWFQHIYLQRWGDADPPGPPQTPLAADETRISIDAGRGILAGTYRDPLGAGAGPAVLILPGAGPVNSDGDSMVSGPGPSNLRMVAEALDKAGYRSLRYDKRGIGDSSRGVIPSSGLKFTDLVSDAADWARYLAGQPKVTCVVLLGHSEGAMVAMLAAQKVKVCGLVSLSGPGRSLGDMIQSQVEHADLSRGVKAQVIPILTSLKAGKPVNPVPEEFSGLQPATQSLLMSQINLDPVSLIQTVKAPVLIIQGDNDLQIPVDDAKRLAAARPDAQLLIVKTMNNVTKSAPSNPDDNIARALEADAPLAKPVMPAVIEFLKQARG